MQVVTAWASIIPAAKANLLLMLHYHRIPSSSSSSNYNVTALLLLLLEEKKKIVLGISYIIYIGHFVARVLSHCIAERAVSSYIVLVYLLYYCIIIMI